MVLSREAIQKVNDLPTEEVRVEEWGGSVLIKSMTGKERDDFEATIQKKSKGKGDDIDIRGLKVLLLSYAIVDEEGKTIFNDKEGREILNSKSAKAINTVFERVQEMNGLTNEQTEELAKNLQDGRNEEAGSDSQDN